MEVEEIEKLIKARKEAIKEDLKELRKYLKEEDYNFLSVWANFLVEDLAILHFLEVLKFRLKVKEG